MATKKIKFEPLHNYGNWETEYARIKRAIPQMWLKTLKNKETENRDLNLLINTKSITVTHDTIQVNGKVTEQKKFRSKDLYYHLLYPQKTPNCITAWNNIIQNDLNWKAIFKAQSKSMQDRKRRDFHWKVLHRAIYTESRLHKMGKSDGLCKICSLEAETTCHLLFECVNANSMWHNLSRKIQNNCNCIYDFNLEDVIFGIQGVHENNFKTFVDFIILEAKWQLWKNRNNVKYGNKTSLSHDQLLEKTIEQCKFHLYTLKRCKSLKLNNDTILLLENYVS